MVSIQNNQSLENTLLQYDSLQYKYITMKSTEKFLDNMIDDGGINYEYDTEVPLSCDDINEEFQTSQQEFMNEMYEYRKEFQRKDELQEEARNSSDNNSIEVDEDEDELQRELEELDNQLSQKQYESTQLELELAEIDELYESALQELQTIKKENHTMKPKQTTKSLPTPNVSTPQKAPSTAATITQENINELEIQEKRLSALLEGLESLLQIKIKGIEYVNIDTNENFLNHESTPSSSSSSSSSSSLPSPSSGISLTLAIKNISYIFLFDVENKLCDIKLHPIFNSDMSQHIPSIDTVKLLCECAPLAPPHDLRHAIFVISSAMSSLSVLKEHIQQIKRRCLVNYIPEEFTTKKKVEITLQNGVTAILRIHECYPYVPNGIHVQSLDGAGGWSSEELTNAKKIVNGMCPSLLQDSVDKLMEVLGE